MKTGGVDVPAGYTVRALTVEDAEPFLVLRQRSLNDEPWSFGASPEDDRFQTIADACAAISADPAEGRSYCVAAPGGELAATAYLAFNARVKFRHRATIFGVYTAPEHRRKGLARALIQALLAEARDLGVSVVGLSASDRAHAAVALYASLGFITWGTEPDAMRIGDASAAEIYMQITL